MRLRMEEKEEESSSRGSCYYPHCRKDANCSCKMCLASINATLDLINPNTVQKSSLTTSSRPQPATPISFHLSTPPTSPQVLTPAPLINSTSSMIRVRGRRRISGGWSFVWRLVLGLSLIVALETGFSLLISHQILRTGEVVRCFGERPLSTELGLNGQVLSCSRTDSSWKIHPEGLLVHSSCCTLYSSAVEEGVRVWGWGWPLHTAGLLTARSFTILSGRVAQWSNAKMGFSALKDNSSTVQSANIVQMDPNTWVLETSRLFSALLELFTYRVSRMSEGLWRFDNPFQADDEGGGGGHFKVPT